jgi:hypothetical protein
MLEQRDDSTGRRPLNSVRSTRKGRPQQRRSGLKSIEAPLATYA